MKILLVDDDKDMMKLTARWLTKSGYEVEQAISGAEALECLDKSNVDLILLDYAMPEMDGPATLQKIREKDKDIKVLFRTGKDDANIEEVVTKYNANGIITKSEGKPQLLAKVAEVLG